MHPVLLKLHRVRTAVFFTAVLALNYTLFRPSPVDLLFVLVMVLSFGQNQKLTRHGLLLILLLTCWIFSVYFSSIALIGDPAVLFQLFALTFVICIGIGSCFVSSYWDEKAYRQFFTVYILASCAAAMLGIVGFTLSIPDLTWDGRAKGFLDDPNMYGAFLLPGILGAIHMISLGRRRLLFSLALLTLTFGLLVSFSRAAIVAAGVWSVIYLLFVYRKKLLKAGFYLAAIASLLVIMALVGDVLIENFGEKLGDRLTVAKEYDLGHGGRYSRYALSIPIIIDNPLGLGLYEIDRIFDEPIHNIWLSSFLNYGWLAGFAWTLLMFLSAHVTYLNYKATRSTFCLVVFFSWAAIISCALLHQAERWRPLWLFTGLVWGFNIRHFRPTLPTAISVPQRQLTRAA